MAEMGGLTAAYLPVSP